MNKALTDCQIQIQLRVVFFNVVYGHSLWKIWTDYLDIKQNRTLSTIKKIQLPRKLVIMISQCWRIWSKPIKKFKTYWSEAIVADICLIDIGPIDIPANDWLGSHIAVIAVEFAIYDNICLKHKGLKQFIFIIYVYDSH